MRIFNQCSSFDCSSDFPLEAESSYEDIFGFGKKEFMGIFMIQIKFCFNNSFSTDSITSLSIILSSILMTCSWKAVTLHKNGSFPLRISSVILNGKLHFLCRVSSVRFLFLHLILSMANQSLGWNFLMIDSKRLS